MKGRIENQGNFDTLPFRSYIVVGNAGLRMAHAPRNLERMIELADAVFGARNDPSQISVNQEVIDLLRKLHPSSLSEETTVDGPIAWMLVFPTLRELMEAFLQKRLTENALLERTPLGAKYSSVYLCSALVLPEYRQRGIALRLVTSAVAAISRSHPIDSLFYWPFSHEGEALAKRASEILGLPLYKRQE